MYKKIAIIILLIISITGIIHTYDTNNTGKATQILEETTIQKTTYISTGKLIATEKNEQINYIHKDRLQSNIKTTNNEQNIISENNYDPYGKNNNQKSELDYTGKTKTKTSTINLGAREYNPQIKRFTTTDPILQDTKSPYNYVDNNPLKYIDPDGKLLRWSGSYKGTSSKELSTRLFEATRIAGFEEAAGKKIWGNYDGYVVSLGSYNEALGRIHRDGRYAPIVPEYRPGAIATLDPKTAFTTRNGKLDFTLEALQSIVHQFAIQNTLRGHTFDSEAEEYFHVGRDHNTLKGMSNKDKEEYIGLRLEAANIGFDAEMKLIQTASDYYIEYFQGKTYFNQEYTEKRLKAIQANRERTIKQLNKELREYLYD